MISAPDDALVLVDADDVGLCVHPHHHHLSTQPCLQPTARLQPVCQHHIFGSEVSAHFLIHRVVEQSINVPDLTQLTRLLGQHRLHRVALVTLLELALRLPLLHVALLVQSQLLLSQV